MREMQHQTILSSSSSRSLRGGDEHDDWEWPTCQAEYTFLEQVGKGATAEVWIAYCDSLDALAAVKKFYLLRKPPTPEKTPNEDPAVQEVAVMRQLDHANILPVLSSWREEEHMWLVTPYCKGGSVAGILQARHPQGLSSEPAIATIASAVLNALAYLHSVGYMHRDVKAANILVGDDGQVRLADFGVACALRDDSDAATLHELQDKPRAAARTTPIGTPVFMAPEVINASNDDGSQPYDERADTWSFGVFLLEMCYGSAPNASSSLGAAALQTLHHPPPQLEDTSDRAYCQELKDLVRLCLDKERTRPAARDLLQHPFVLKHSLKNEELSEILFRIPEPQPGSNHARRPSSHSSDATEPAALTAALVETAQHGLALLQRSVSTKLPRPASNSWMADFQHHFADLHLPMFQSQQHLKQDEIAACKAIMIGTASRRGKLLTSSGHGRGFVMAKGTCMDADGSPTPFWSAPYFLRLVGHGIGLSVGRERLSYMMLLPSTAALLGSGGQLQARSRLTSSRSSMGHRTSVKNMVSARGCSIRTITFLEGHQADLTSIALQIEGDVERNTAVYGDADVSAVLEGTVRPPEPFRQLIDALIAIEN